MTHMDVTVLYYDEDNMTEIRHSHLSCPTTQEMRPQLTPAFRHNKIIVAVLKGHVEVLNTLGERYLPAPEPEQITARG
jgi:hypothetical protein